jgi:hypothetical protein
MPHSIGELDGELNMLGDAVDPLENAFDALLASLNRPKRHHGLGFRDRWRGVDGLTGSPRIGWTLALLLACLGGDHLTHDRERIVARIRK